MLAVLVSFMLSLSLAQECSDWSDCHQEGGLCHNLADAGCVCKAGRCKISSGCGTQGAFFYRSCNSCNEDDCEDEGTCLWRGGECVARPTGTRTAGDHYSLSSPSSTS